MPFETDSGGITEEVGFDIDEAAARRVADQLARLLSHAMTDALRGARQEMSGILLQFGRGHQVRDVAEDFERVGKAIFSTEKRAEELNEDLASLITRSQAFKRQLAATGNESNLLAGFDVQLRRLVQLQSELKKRRSEIADDPQLLNALRNEVIAVRQALVAEQVTAGRVIDATRSRFVVETQRDAAQQLAETRINGFRQLQQERQRSRARIEIFRQASRQIIFFERQIRDAVRGTLALMGSIAGGIRNSLGRVGQTLFRSNRSINEGLNGALIQREKSMDRSFSKQTSIIRSETTKQSRLIERVQVKASTGVIGAATGRSTAGSLLGGGLAFGGGFLLLSKLKEGFAEAVNFNESLNKTRQIFGDVAGDIEAFADDSVKALFVTRSAALEAAANFGIFGRAAGLQGKPLADFSKKLTLLATDLASFNNTSVADAATAISAALRGESEPIRRFGVLLNEDTLQATALAEGIIDTKRKLQPFERVLAANVEILKQTTVAQGDAARTADDFANSSRRAKAASIETFSTIAGAFVPVATFFTNFTFVTLPRLNAFIKGEVSPTLKILRDGLIGAGIALGGLLAARAAGEALQFLALGLKLVLTPLGLFIAIVAGLGAAINILSKRSPAMRAAIDQIRDAFGTVFNKVLSEGVELLDRLGRLIDKYVIPVLDRFAQFLARNVRGAIETTFGFITNKVVPGVRAAATAIADFSQGLSRNLFGRSNPDVTEDGAFGLGERVGLKIRQGVDIAIEALEDLKRVAVRVFNTIKPVLDPVIEGFGNLGGAIRDAALQASHGDFSGVLDGLQGLLGSIGPTQIAAAVGLGAIGTAVGGPVGAAIGVAIGLGLGDHLHGIGAQIVDIVKPQLENALGFIRDFFTGKSHTAGGAAGKSVKNFLLGPFQEAVTALGFFLGNISTDPKLIAALEKIVGLAVLTGANFVKGFVGGVLSNIPGLFNLLGGQFIDALKIAFKSVVLDPKVLVGVIALAFAGPVALRAWRAAGTAGAKGMLKGFSTGLTTGVRNTPQFVRGLFGGPDALRREAARQGAGAKQELTRTFQAINRDIQALGGTTGGRFKVIDQAAVDDANQRLLTMRENVGEVGARALIARDRIRRAFEGFGDIKTGIGNAINRDLSAAETSVKVGAGKIKLAIRDSLTDFGAKNGGLGRGIGNALGVGILGGVGAALSGQALGTATSGAGKAIGLAGIIGSALAAGITVGGGPGVIVGGAIAAIGLLTAAFSDNGEAARISAERVEHYTGILQKFQTISAASGEIASQFTSDLLDQNPAVRALAEQLGDAGLNATGVIQAFADRRFTPEENFGLLNRVLGVTDEQIQRTGLSFEELIDTLSTGTPPGDITPRNATALREIFDQFSAKGINRTAFADLFRFLDDEFGAIGTSIDKVELERLFNPDAQHDALHATQQQIEATGTLGQAQQNYVDLLLQAAGTSTALEEAGDRQAQNAAERNSQIQQAVELLNQQRTDEIQGQIELVGSALDAARTAAQDARDALLNYLQGDYGDAAMRAIGELVLAVPGVASSLQDSFTLTPTLKTFSQAKVLADLGTATNDALAQGILDGSVIDTATARDKLKPFFDAITELQNIPIEPVIDQETGVVIEAGGGISDEAAALMRDQINGKLDDETFQVLIDTVKSADDTQEQLQTVMDALKVELGVEVFFSEEQIRAAFLEVIGKALPGLIPPEFLQPVIDVIPVTNLSGAVVGAQNVLGGVPSTSTTTTTNTTTNNTTVPAPVQAAIPSVNLTNINNITTTQPEETAAAIARRLRTFAAGVAS